MASVQLRNGRYRVLFRFQGRQHTYTLGKVSEREAVNEVHRVDTLFMRLDQGLKSLPAGADIVEFVKRNGALAVPSERAASPPTARVTLSDLRDRYLGHFPASVEKGGTLSTRTTHFRNLAGFFEEGFLLEKLTRDKLQEYVKHREGLPIKRETIEQELGTFGAAWRWGVSSNLTAGDFPNQRLEYSPVEEKLPFMTRAEILRHIEAGEDPKKCWEALYLQADEVAGLLDLVKGRDELGWVHPLIAFAAYTGARRSEIIRARVVDVNFEKEKEFVTIREKKRRPGRPSRRQVPLHPDLQAILREWLQRHPGGPHLFCFGGQLPRSKKRSPNKGFAGRDLRSSAPQGQSDSTPSSSAALPDSLTRNEVHDHVKRIIRDSDWENMRGLHCLRHSFISACASNGVEQRFIDEWVGHQTEEQRRRYRHLWPSTQHEAIKKAFVWAKARRD